MVVLKKIKGSTLMETLVATVLIVAIFMISSMILNNLFSNALSSRTDAIEAHVNELHYLYLNNSLEVPHYEDFGNWNISVEFIKDPEVKYLVFGAINEKTNKELNRSFYAEN